MRYIHLIHKKCGKYNKRYDITGKTDKEIILFVNALNYDSSKYTLIKEKNK